MAPGQFRHQKLVMQSGQDLPEFADRHEVVAVGTLGGRRSWTPPMPGGARESRVRQCARVEGMVVHPPDAVIMGVQARLIDPKGAICVSQTVQW